MAAASSFALAMDEICYALPANHPFVLYANKVMAAIDWSGVEGEPSLCNRVRAITTWDQIVGLSNDIFDSNDDDIEGVIKVADFIEDVINQTVIATGPPNNRVLALSAELGLEHDSRVKALNIMWRDQIIQQ